MNEPARDEIDRLEPGLLDQLRRISDRVCGVHLHTYIAPCSHEVFLRYGVMGEELTSSPDAPKYVKHRVLTLGVNFANDPERYLLLALMMVPTTTEALREWFPGVEGWRKIDGMQPISVHKLVGLN